MTERKSPEPSPAGKLWQYAQNLLRGRSPSASSGTGTEAAPDSQVAADPCCGPHVHIAFRGKSDDRMYVTYSRTWQEVRFYQPNGLRVFCAGCRRRLL